MAFAKRIDDNQNQIVKVMRDMGASVWITSSMGKGAPDLVVAARLETIAVELKDGSKAPSRRKLTPCEQKFHDNWQGKIAIIESVEEAIALVQGLGR